MNKLHLLVSGSEDQTIVIWNQDQIGSWKQYFILKGFQPQIASLINNENEDLIISSGSQAIKFWRKTMNWSCQQTIQIPFSLIRLSLSKSGKRLIACGQYNYIIVIITQQKQNQRWSISQKIPTNYYGYNITFISENQFVYQEYSNYLEIYFYDQDEKQFVKEQQINTEIYEQLYYGDYPFLCKYIEQKNILIIPNGRYLNFFRIDQQQNYILQQSIFEFLSFRYNISNTGQYIVLQLRYSDQIEIRKLQFLERIK